MPSLWGVARALASANRVTWEVTVSHPGLGLTRTFRGRDQVLVEQRANAQAIRWDEQWARRQFTEEKRQSADQRRQEKEQALQEAANRTQAAQEARLQWETILANRELDPAPLAWAPEPTPFSEAKPDPPKLGPPPTTPELLDEDIQQTRRDRLTMGYPVDRIGQEPKREDRPYAARGGLGRLFNTQGYRDRVAAAQQHYAVDHAAWAARKSEHDKEVLAEFQRDVNAARAQHDAAVTQWRARSERKRADHQSELDAWTQRKNGFEETQRQEHARIQGLEDKYRRATKDGVERFLDLACASLRLPDFVPGDVDFQYSPTTKSAVIEYALPAPNQVPTTKEVKYVASRQAFDETRLSEKATRELYDNAVYQIVLRVLHDLFTLDKAKVIESITLNGIVEATSKATGKQVSTCILSLQATRDQILDLNFDFIDAKDCFRSLKGVGSSQLAGLSAIAPIATLDKTDRRFVPAKNVATAMEKGPNIATMDWEEFEHLVRELFEKEFSHDGSEVKITRASRDAGVDAVVFDPDPIRGGKIIIQAKRYSHTVDVSAVRDLYGTVLNEGANKGILVTTSEFGPDAHAFAKGKPITLLTGGNLLHLLQKHGYKARLDLDEAKTLLRQGSGIGGRFRN